MSTSPEYAEYVLGQLFESGDVRRRNMFGGIGVYVDDIFCAIISSNDRFYLRVGPGNIAEFENEGMLKFPGEKGAGMPYYEVPEHVLEEPPLLKEWVERSRSAAIQAKK